MKYTSEMLLEDLRKVITTCIGGITVASLIYFFGPSGIHFEQDPSTRKTVENHSWSAVTDTYEAISRDASQLNLIVDTPQYGEVIKANGGVYVQLNLPKGKSLSIAADRPYSLIKVEGVRITPSIPKNIFIDTGEGLVSVDLKATNIGVDGGATVSSLLSEKHEKTPAPSKGNFFETNPE